MKTIAKIKLIKTLQIQHEETGSEARLQREKRQLSLRKVATKMNISPSYLCDLELGRRKWNMKKIRLFEASVESLSY